MSNWIKRINDTVVALYERSCRAPKQLHMSPADAADLLAEIGNPFCLNTPVGQLQVFVRPFIAPGICYVGESFE